MLSRAAAAVATSPCDSLRPFFPIRDFAAAVELPFLAAAAPPHPLPCVPATAADAAAVSDEGCNTGAAALVCRRFDGAVVTPLTPLRPTLETAAPSAACFRAAPPSLVDSPAAATPRAGVGVAGAGGTPRLLEEGEEEGEVEEGEGGTEEGGAENVVGVCPLPVLRESPDAALGRSPADGAVPAAG